MAEETNRYDFESIEQKWQRLWDEKQAFVVKEDSQKPKYYALEMFPYPSGAGLHVGHLKNYIPMDTFCRYKRMSGFNVLYPMGWDAFGQPAENEAINRGRNPREMVPEYASNYKKTLKSVGSGYDWTREINSSLPDYYKWTQWFFLLLYKRRLAYRANAPINWCPSCKTGLANEEVKEGRCWRCDSQVTKRSMKQWFFKITAYADRLLSDLEQIDWSEGLKEMQRNWIGKSQGVDINFKIHPVKLSASGGHPQSGISQGKDSTDSIKVFTTRDDTIFGATFLVLAPEHPILKKIVTPDKQAEVENYISASQCITEIDRLNAERSKTGVWTGAYAINPANKKNIPIWVADYVLMEYGSGAIMGVPAHDQRDFEFARKFNLEIVMVYHTPDGPNTESEMSCAVPDGGTVINSAHFNDLPDSPETRKKFTEWVETSGFGKKAVQYRLRDWLISRQRYWGAPIPVIHCEKCGEAPVPETDLPVLLPEVDNYQPSGTGESPLATIPEFVNTNCPKCKSPAKRETDTMGGYACSSWYFLRFADPHNDKAFADRKKIDYWLPVDLYSGGVEHARSHLLYSRFWCKVMYDAGLIAWTEPFKILRNQGSMLALTPGRKPRSAQEKGDTEDSIVDWIVLKEDELNSFPKDKIVWKWARMSKSKGNTISPDEIIKKYGADSLRLYEMFVAPFEEDVQWTEDGIKGSYRFVNRLWRWLANFTSEFIPDWKERIGTEKFDSNASGVRRKLHQTIKKAGADIENFRFNTAISSLMELVNDLYAYAPPAPPKDAQTDSAPDFQKIYNKVLISEVLENLVLITAPFAPHLAEEIWEKTGKKEFACHSKWPSFDPDIAKESELTIVIQVNGKLRSRITVPAETDDKQIEQAVYSDKTISKLIKDKQILKTIVVRKKLVNIVVK